ncbi:hypothetical protein BCV70DRAFT_197245 [Testicularia cyperi]|uniref:AAAP amino acid permease n=1 Tax=Testicularia cyperi TaxID=1882483 RepID=A0A317Y052_9BASI|nr:hypothetical protein BCV70DRAFT_197245 [Testicularia cyperi]
MSGPPWPPQQPEACASGQEHAQRNRGANNRGDDAAEQQRRQHAQHKKVTPPGTPTRKVSDPDTEAEIQNGPPSPWQTGVSTSKSGRTPTVTPSPVRTRLMAKGLCASPAKGRDNTLDMGTSRLDSIQESDQGFGSPQLLFRSPSGAAATVSAGPSRSSKPKLDRFDEHFGAKKGSDDEAYDTDIGDQPDIETASVRPPSFAESQFATIIRRQRKRRVVSPTTNIQALGISSALDIEARHTYPPTQLGSSDPASVEPRHDAPSSDPPWADLKDGQLKVGPGAATTLATDRSDPMMAIHRAWEFAGWGSISLLELPPNQTLTSPQDHDSNPRKSPELGQWKASAIAGNAVTGSVFYALPAVVGVSSVLSPISILIACLLLYPFRPVICELASALSASNAGNYSYMSNVTNKTIAVLAAAITLLDAVATGAVSAGTASAYIAGETAGSRGTIDGRIISILLLVGLAVFCLAGLRESSTLALAMFLLHVTTMAMLIVAGTIAWIRLGNGVLKENWIQGIASLSAEGTGRGIARAIFDGICVAFVGLTGVECSPSYINQVKPGQFPKALRNLHLIIISTEAPLMLLVLAVVPIEQVLSGANVLSLLGEVAGRGHWLKLFVVIDACLVLCGGIITGVVAFCGLIDSLCQDRVVPAFFQQALPRTGATYLSIALFLGLTLVMSATSGFNLTTLSSVFSVSFLCVMTLFGISLSLLKFSRPSLPRSPVVGMGMVLTSMSIGITAMAGNFALSPVIIVQTLVYFLVLAGLLLVLAHRVDIARVMVWLVEHHRQTLSWRLLTGAEKRIIRWIRGERRSPVIYFTKTDDISVLVNALAYIQRNEPTSKCKLVHCYGSIEEIPEQLDETFQLVDEIFPMVTVDLVFVEAPFTPQVVHAITTKLGVSKSRAFISCPSGRGRLIGSMHPLSDYGGVRIILP